jgi:hypothetical protein
MWKYVRVGVPLFVVMASIVNFFNAASIDNTFAMAGYVTAFFGWVLIAYDEYLTFRRENRSS